MSKKLGFDESDTRNYFGCFYNKKRKQVIFFNNSQKKIFHFNLKKKKGQQNLVGLPLIFIFGFFFLVVLFAFKDPIIGLLNVFANNSGIPAFAKFMLIFGLPFVILLGFAIWFFSGLRGGTTG